MSVYSINQIVWACLYIGNYCFISISSVLFLIKVLPNKYTTIEKAIFGIGLVPYLLGVWMILVSFLPAFLGKQYFSIVVPLGLALANFLIWSNTLTTLYIQIRAFLKQNIFCVACFGVILGLLAFSCVYNISGYMAYTDAGFYTAEALQFSRSLSFHDIASHVESTTHINGSVHNFVWPAYISYSMMFSTPGDFGLGHDAAMFLSIRIIPLLVLLVISTLCYELSGFSCKIMLFGVMLFCLSPFQNIIAAYSRDLFRIIPLLLLIVLLNRELQIKHNQITKSEIALCMVIGFATPSGHPINAFTAFVIGLAWLILHIVRNREIVESIKYTASLVVGFVFGIYNIIYAFLDTGEFDGNCSLYMEHIMEGTDLEQIYLSNMESTTSRGLGLLETVEKIFSGDIYHVVLICAVTLIISCVILKLNKKSNLLNIFPVTVFLASFLMIFLGHFIIWGSFRYDEWLARNSRYMFHFYFIAVLAFASAIAAIKNIVCPCRVLKGAISICAICLAILCGTKLYSDYIYLSNQKEWELDVAATTIHNINAVIEEAGDKQVWITQTDYAYDTGLRANLLSSYYGKELFNAQTPNDIREFLDSNNIEFMCFEGTYLHWIYEKSHFYQILINMDEVSEYLTTDNLVVYRYSGEG